MLTRPSSPPPPRLLQTRPQNLLAPWRLARPLLTRYALSLSRVAHLPLPHPPSLELGAHAPSLQMMRHNLFSSASASNNLRIPHTKKHSDPSLPPPPPSPTLAPRPSRPALELLYTDFSFRPCRSKDSPPSTPRSLLSQARAHGEHPSCPSLLPPPPQPPPSTHDCNTTIHSTSSFGPPRPLTDLPAAKGPRPPTGRTGLVIRPGSAFCVCQGRVCALPASRSFLWWAGRNGRRRRGERWASAIASPLLLLAVPFVCCWEGCGLGRGRFGSFAGDWRKELNFRL